MCEPQKAVCKAFAWKYLRVRAQAHQEMNQAQPI